MLNHSVILSLVISHMNAYNNNNHQRNLEMRSKVNKGIAIDAKVNKNQQIDKKLQGLAEKHYINLTQIELIMIGNFFDMIDVIMEDTLGKSL